MQSPNDSHDPGMDDLPADPPLEGDFSDLTLMRDRRGRTTIADTRNPRAWIQADTTVDVVRLM